MDARTGSALAHGRDRGSNIVLTTSGRCAGTSATRTSALPRFLVEVPANYALRRRREPYRGHAKQLQTLPAALNCRTLISCVAGQGESRYIPPTAARQCEFAASDDEAKCKLLIFQGLRV